MRKNTMLGLFKFLKICSKINFRNFLKNFFWKYLKILQIFLQNFLNIFWKIFWFFFWKFFWKSVPPPKKILATPMPLTVPEICLPKCEIICNKTWNKMWQIFFYAWVSFNGVQRYKRRWEHICILKWLRGKKAMKGRAH